MDKQGGAEVLRFDARVKGGKLVNSDGKPIRLKDGAAATLFVAADALAEPPKPTSSVELLPAGARLIANIRPGTDNPRLLRGLLHVNGEELDGASRGGFVEIVLGEPLRMNPAKGKRGELADVACAVPAIPAQATSINHAYTLISELYEPRRKSHTGNVFREVFYHDAGTARWRRLETLREAALAAPNA